MEQSAMERSEVSIGTCLRCTEPITHEEQFVELPVQQVTAQRASLPKRDTGAAEYEPDTMRVRTMRIHSGCIRPLILHAITDPPFDARDIRSRAHPKHMETDEIQAEAKELGRYLRSGDDDLDDELHSRTSAMYHVLKERLDIDFPTCPKCGASIRYSDLRFIVVPECHHELPESTVAEFEEAMNELWASEIDDDPDDLPVGFRE